MTKNFDCSTLLRLAATLVLLLLPLQRLHAQYENGSLLGAIRDSSGSAIPHANVTVTNTATGITNQTTTDDAGDYNVPQLRVGVYSVTANAPGFASAVAKNITVSIGNRQRIDLTLKVGSTEVSVEVSDIALQIQTDSESARSDDHQRSVRSVAACQPQLH